MRLSTADALACSKALGDVRRKAEAASQTHDVESAMRALHEVSVQTMRAMALLRDAESRARNEALEESEKRFQAQIHYLTEHRA